ncbi:CAP domain-containing protein [Actinoplanes sp. NPDC020271]|uniref:CAP domain-containing protein n=1 Tax=Actinoplanes sp. NPDC020271 TaxID=3363896 RepID=UPI0037AF7784
MRKSLVVLGLIAVAGGTAATRAAAREPAVADPIAASHTAVTAASISDSPAAPVQQQVLALINHNRGKAGCSAVTVDRRLIEAANRHAAYMARNDYFAHSTRRGQDPGERVTGAGYRWSLYRENLALGQDSPWDVVAGWMTSPEHRANILNCQLHQMGIGLAINAKRTPYWVQELASPL